MTFPPPNFCGLLTGSLESECGLEQFDTQCMRNRGKQGVGGLMKKKTNLTKSFF